MDKGREAEKNRNSHTGSYLLRTYYVPCAMLCFLKSLHLILTTILGL